MASVRELIGGIQRTVRDSADLSPEKQSELLNKLTALLGNVLNEVRERETAYRIHYADCRRHSRKPTPRRSRRKRAAVRRKWREAQDLKTVTEQLIISLRSSVRLHTEEMRLAK
jgi:uncharacterized membrane-anchored protein